MWIILHNFLSILAVLITMGERMDFPPWNFLSYIFYSSEFSRILKEPNTKSSPRWVKYVNTHRTCKSRSPCLSTRSNTLQVLYPHKNLNAQYLWGNLRGSFIPFDSREFIHKINKLIMWFSLLVHDRKLSANIYILKISC